MNLDGLIKRAGPGGTRFEVRVTPRASKNEVGGVRDGRLVVRVTAPPVDDAANDAVIDVLAAVFGVAKRTLRIVSGHRSRTKVIEGPLPP